MPWALVILAGSACGGLSLGRPQAFIDGKSPLIFRAVDIGAAIAVPVLGQACACPGFKVGTHFGARQGKGRTAGVGGMCRDSERREEQGSGEGRDRDGFHVGPGPVS